MATLPPWLQINPEQFTQAAIAGGQQGYQAAAEAGSLAQRGLLAAVQLAQESAAKAAEIAVRREQINAELAQNAARVSAARAEAAAQNSIRQQQVDLARIAEENQRVNEAARIQSAMDINAANIQGEKDVAGIRANAPQSFEPPQLLKLQQAYRQAVQNGDDKTAKEIQGQIDRLTTPASRGLNLSGVPLNPNAPGALLSTPTVSGPLPLVQEFQRTNAPAIPVGGPSTNLWDQFNAWRR